MDVIKVIGKRMSLAHPSGKCKCVCVYVCVCVCICVCTCVCMHACMYSYMYVYVNACKHPFVMACHNPTH